MLKCSQWDRGIVMAFGCHYYDDGLGLRTAIGTNSPYKKEDQIIGGSFDDMKPHPKTTNVPCPSGDCPMT